MEIIQRPIEFNRPEVGTISATSFARQFLEFFAIQNNPNAHSQKLNLPELGANHYSDYKRTIEKNIDSPFVLSFINLFEEVKGINPEKKRQLGTIDEVIYQRLCEAERNSEKIITIEATRNGQPIKITLEDLNSSNVEIDFGDGRKITVENLDFKAIKDVLELHIVGTLKDRVADLSEEHHRLAWVEVLGENLSYKEHEQLGSSNFLSTSYASNTNERIYRSTDVGTLVKQEGIVAITVIDGEHEKIDGRIIDLPQLPIYSAIVTTAAMHTVERGVLVHGLEKASLQTFFIDTIKLLLTAHNINVDPNQWPAFKGVVLYEYGHPEIKHSKFEYRAEGGELGVTAQVSNLDPSEIIHLTATENAKDHGALHVELKTKQALTRDDFDIIDNELVIYHNHKAREKDYSPESPDPEGCSKTALQKKYQRNLASKQEELKILRKREVFLTSLNQLQEMERDLANEINNERKELQIALSQVKKLKEDLENEVDNESKEFPILLKQLQKLKEDLENEVDPDPEKIHWEEKPENPPIKRETLIGHLHEKIADIESKPKYRDMQIQHLEEKIKGIESARAYRNEQIQQLKKRIKDMKSQIEPPTGEATALEREIKRLEDPDAWIKDIRHQAKKIAEAEAGKKNKI